MASTVVGLFDSHIEADNAVRELEMLGFSQDSISVAISGEGETVVPSVTGLRLAHADDAGCESARAQEYSARPATYRDDLAGTTDSVIHDAEVLGAGGAAIGGILGLLAGLGALAIPGVGPILAAGPIAALFGGGIVGGAAGIAAGGFIGALVSLGVDPAAAKRFAEHVKSGGTLVAVTASEYSASAAASVFHRHRATNIGEQTGQTQHAA